LERFKPAVRVRSGGVAAAPWQAREDAETVEQVKRREGCELIAKIRLTMAGVKFEMPLPKNSEIAKSDPS